MSSNWWSESAGSALHRWEEVTAAGLLLLAAARAWKKGTERVKAQDTETQSRDGRNVRRDRPALLVYGACDGLLASFLAQHAPEAPQTLHSSHRCPFVHIWGLVICFDLLVNALTFVFHFRFGLSCNFV